MEKEKKYEQVRFSAEVIEEAYRIFKQQADPENRHSPDYTLSVEVDGAEWSHDTLHDFFADYRRTSRGAYYKVRLGFENELSVRVHSFDSGDDSRVNTSVEVEAASRSRIEAVFEVFERHVENSRIPQKSLPEQSIKIFIGHGHDSIWRDLKDHLHEKHNYDVITYEIGARAGRGIQDTLEDLLKSSSFAILIMAGEDRTKDDQLHPRLNVVHELGLFQGRLGFNRAIALLEEGIQEFSNINGVHQIRFSKGNIRETFGDVLATLKREFSENSDDG